MMMSVKMAKSSRKTMPVPKANGDIILSARNITKVFPGTKALVNVTYNIRKGKVNVLIGENGAGKSTLMKILAGVEKPTSGKIFLDGEEIQVKTVPHEYRKVWQ